MTKAAQLKTQAAGVELAWWSVETPSVFREYELPQNRADDTPQQKAQREELERLAERHGTSARAYPIRRG